MKLKLKYLLLTAMFIVSMVARGQDFNPEDPIEPAATPINLKVVVVPAGAGTVKGGGKYKAGTSVTLSTTRNEGYVFLHWEDSKGNILSESTQFTYVKKSYEEKANEYMMKGFWSVFISGLFYKGIRQLAGILCLAAMRQAMVACLLVC